MPVVAQTFQSDLNELSLGYFLNGERWWNADVREVFEDRVRMLKADNRQDIVIQVERSRHMAVEVQKHIGANTVHAVYWVSRGNGAEICPDMSSGHPADLLLVTGQHNEWFGISAKSTNGRGDIGFKNPGLGTIEKALNISLSGRINEVTQDMVTRYHLPDAQEARKKYIRSNTAVQSVTTMQGTLLLNEIRTSVLNACQNASQAVLRSFLLTSLIDSDSDTFPRYVKVTGYGSKRGEFGARLLDPFSVDYSGSITVEAAGNDAVRFLHEDDGVCVLRAKFESEKLASTVKFSVDPA